MGQWNMNDDFLQRQLDKALRVTEQAPPEKLPLYTAIFIDKIKQLDPARHNLWKLKRSLELASDRRLRLPKMKPAAV